jgi:SAM-dependent methyltransferase
VTANEDLDQYLATYANDPFGYENEMMLYNYATRCVKYSSNRENYLELGIGHGITLGILARNFSKVVVLEGSARLINEYANRFNNVEMHEVYFEKFTTTEKFYNIGMGFVLEHVDDPVCILNKFRQRLTSDGSIFIGVPCASSLHRLLAFKASLMKDIRAMSQVDLDFGHKRFLTYDDWCQLLHNEGFNIVHAEGLYLKPFTTSQISSLKLDPKIYEALASVAIDYPQISNSLFFEVKNG